MVRFKLIGLSIFLLYGCATPTLDIKQVCLPLATYSIQQQKQFAEEDKRLKSDGHYPLTIQRIMDFEAMRDADRTCLEFQSQ
jgi:hypothetical protein